MIEAVTFDDVLIVPNFSTIKSRKDVDLTSMGLKLPIISSNMDSVTGPEMCKAMAEAGGVGCLHRFMDIDANVKMFKDTAVKPWVSIGLGNQELDRALALYDAGAETIVIDVAHAASTEAVKQFKNLWDLDRDLNVVVGNFGHGTELADFINAVGGYHCIKNADFKVGIGGGSACTTRIETGCGYPTLGAILSCRGLDINVIADGGIRTPGDAAKALAAGAKAVMIGGMLAGTEETPTYKEALDKYKKEYSYAYDSNGFSKFDNFRGTDLTGYAKSMIKSRGLKYRGSASKESYEVQGKDESWRTAEGESFTVPYKGPAKEVLERIAGGLRSAYSYVGAENTKTFQEKAELIRITGAGIKENGAHGKT